MPSLRMGLPGQSDSVSGKSFLISVIEWTTTARTVCRSTLNIHEAVVYTDFLMGWLCGRVPGCISCEEGPTFRLLRITDAPQVVAGQVAVQSRWSPATLLGIAAEGGARPKA